jgi:uncharacterized protein (DUF1778 family)
MSTTAAANSVGKSDRFNIRTTSREKSLVELAATLARVSTSQFVLQAAVRSAEEVLADQTRFVLSPEKWEAFVEALDRPAREVPALKRAIAKPSPFSGR